MKKLFSTLIFFLLTCFVFSQVPQKFSYQAIAYNTSNVIVTTPISLEICIRDNSLTGTIIYKERFANIQPTAQGLFSLNIGEGVIQTPFDINTFKNINWGTNTKHLEVKIDPTSGTGTNYTVSGGNQLMSVPYALYSQNSKPDPIKSLATVATIQDLRNYTSFNPENNNENATVYVQGYTSPSDGGGGTFIFKTYDQMGVARPAAGSDYRRPVSDEGVFVASLAVAVSPFGIWVRQFSGDIDVRYYGAAGLGGDYTVEIQRAINYAAKSIDNAWGVSTDPNARPYGCNRSNTVYLPNGNYLIRQLIIRSGVRMKGASMLYTGITSFDDTNNALIVMPTGSGPTRDVHFSDMNFYGNSGTFTNGRRKGCFNFTSSGSGSGLWESSFKNIYIHQFTGDGMHFEGSTTENDYTRTNQFITMEGVSIESVSPLYTTTNQNPYHALAIVGLNGQFAFNNCRFDGGPWVGSMPQPPSVNGIAVYIGGTTPGYINPAMINFNTCSFQTANTGVWIESCNNINMIGCWFESLENSISVKGQYRKSKAINVSGCVFSNAAGKYGGTVPNSGRFVSLQNSNANVQNNYILESVEQSDKPRFISVDDLSQNTPAPNIGVTASGNYFEVVADGLNGANNRKLGYSSGIKRDIPLTSTSPSLLNLEGAKTTFVKMTPGITKIIDEITSATSPGEIIFIRAVTGTIRFNESKNIYLGNMNGSQTIPDQGYLDLPPGGVAIFMKVDETLYKGGQEYYETYNLISYKLKQ